MKRSVTFFLLLLAGYASSGQNIQGGLETWRTYSSGFPVATQLEAPDGWFGADSLLYNYAPFVGATPQKLLFKSNITHGGSFAAKLMSRDVGGTIGVVPGLLSNAEPGVDVSNLDPNDPLASLYYTGGTPVSQRVYQVSAWVRYEPNGNDTAQVFVQTVLDDGAADGSDSVVGYGYMVVNQNNSYIQISVPVTYINNVDIPNKLIIGFLSSSGTPKDNSTLYVDDVSYSTVGITDPGTAGRVVSIFPNPAKDIINIQSVGNKNLIWQAYNLQGQQVASRTFYENVSVGISDIPSGLYVYRVLDKAGVVVQRGTFNVSK